MNARTTRRSVALLGGTMLVGSMLLAPTASFAAPVAAESERADACEITDGTLSWGVKESFRSYISGSIANGDWDTSDGATYETPNFLWSGGTGSIDPETGTGSISFVGTIDFSGHEGVLNSTLSNPTIEFDGDGKASLLLDAKSNDASGEVTVDTEQEWVGDVSVPGSLGSVDGVLELDSLATTLTNAGAKAFAGFYEAGAELDPITLAATVSGCELGAQTAVTPDEPEQLPVAPETPGMAADAGTQIPWLPIGIGAVALLVIGVTGGMLLGGRGKQTGAGTAQKTTPNAPQNDVSAE